MVRCRVREATKPDVGEGQEEETELFARTQGHASRDASERSPEHS